MVIQSLEDQTPSGQNGCLTPSHSIIQPLNLDFGSQIVHCLFFDFQIVIQEMKPYNFPLLNCNLGNKALILNLRISICHSNVMHHLNGYINGHLESRRSDFVWTKSVPNTFPFYNLALESRFWFIDSALSFLCFQIVIQEMKPCNFPLLNYNIGNKAL